MMDLYRVSIIDDGVHEATAIVMATDELVAVKAAVDKYINHNGLSEKQAQNVQGRYIRVVKDGVALVYRLAFCGLFDTV